MNEKKKIDSEQEDKSTLKIFRQLDTYIVRRLSLRKNY